MKKKLYLAMVISGLCILTSCAKNEECVCNNTDNITESDAKDVGITLNEACDFAKSTADASCRIE